MTKIHRKSLVLAVVAGASITVFSSSVAAAEEEAVEYAGEGMVLEEVIVTATRRETSIQSAALTISAFAGEDLEKNGYNNVGQFIDMVPGVMAVAGAPGATQIIIRNISTSTQEPGSPTTATYLDDVSLGRLGSSLRLVDINRVEVLKGPQGTLFGQSAMGGIVRNISNRPDPEGFAGGINVYLSDTTDGGTNYGGHGYFNLPINDSLAVRIVAYDYQNSGFMDNVELQDYNYNEEDTRGGRIAVRWDASDTFSVNLLYLQQEVDAAPNTVSTTWDPGDLDVAGDEGPDIPYDVEARTTQAGLVQEDSRDQEVINLKLENYFESFTATFLATNVSSVLDRTYEGRDFVGFRSGTINSHSYIETDSDILEFRLVSSSDNFIDWIAGLYYEDTEIEDDALFRYYGPTQFLFGFIPILDDSTQIDARYEDYNKEKAVYGELGFNFTPETKLTLGYRHSKIEFGTLLLKADGFFDILQGTRQYLDVPFDTKEDANTYKLSLDHNFNDNIFGYATATSGYRRGGFNKPTAISPFSTFVSDELWNYELGLKSILMGGRMIANISAYYIDYDDIQLTIQDPISFARTTQNVGKAQVTGIEFGLAYQLNDYVDFSLNGSFSDPELKEDIPTPEGFPIQGSKGDRLPGSPVRNFAFMTDFVRPMNSDFDLFGNFIYKYVGQRWNNFESVANVESLSAYSMVDMRAGVRAAKGYSISLFVHNLFDEAVNYLIDHRGPTFEAVPTNRPRTFGINFTYDF